MASLGATIADLEAIAPDPRLWYKHGGAAPVDAESVWDLGLVPHAVLPLLCLLPASVAAVRFIARGRYDIAVVASCVVFVAQAYHHCRLTGEGHLGLLDALPQTDVTCTMWRKVDVLVLMSAMAFVAAHTMGLADLRIIGIACTIFPAKAVHLVLIEDSSRYHAIAHILFWWLFVVVANPLMVRCSMEGGLSSLDAALHPDLRKRDPLRKVVAPFFIGLFCFAAPFLGTNLIGDPEIYWPSLWGCHAALGLTMCGILGAELRSVAEAEASIRAAAAPPEPPTARRADHRIAPQGDKKPKEMSGKIRQKVSSALSDVATELAEKHEDANPVFTKVRVNGTAKVAIEAPGMRKDETGEAKWFGGEPLNNGDVTWAPQYKLEVSLDIAVSYSQAYEQDDGDLQQSFNGKMLGGDRTKVTKRRCNGHLEFELTHTTGAADADMTVTLRSASTAELDKATMLSGGKMVPTDVDGHNAARMALTEVASKLRGHLAGVVTQIEKDMLFSAVGPTFYAMG